MSGGTGGSGGGGGGGSGGGGEGGAEMCVTWTVTEVVGSAPNGSVQKPLSVAERLTRPSSSSVVQPQTWYHSHGSTHGRSSSSKTSSSKKSPSCATTSQHTYQSGSGIAFTTGVRQTCARRPVLLRR